MGSLNNEFLISACQTLIVGVYILRHWERFKGHFLICWEVFHISIMQFQEALYDVKERHVVH